MKKAMVKAKPKYAFGNPLPDIGDLVWASLTRRRRVQGILVRRTKKQVVIHPEGGVDITVERPE